MSPFSAVDASPDPAALIAYLDTTAAGLAGMKHYVAAAAGRAVPGGRVLDVGCGAGHDLALLAAAGLRPLGIDPSGAMLAAAADRAGAPAAPGGLVQGDGERLPFRSGSLDGCRIERVLQHVDRPDHVIAEVARVLRPGGFLAVFEPDWATLRFGDGATARIPPDRAPAPAPTSGPSPRGWGATTGRLRPRSCRCGSPTLRHGSRVSPTRTASASSTGWSSRRTPTPSPTIPSRSRPRWPGRWLRAGSTPPSPADGGCGSRRSTGRAGSGHRGPRC